MNCIDNIFDKERLFSSTPRVKISDRTVKNSYGKTSAIYIGGERYKGEETWNFAYVGIPNCAMPENGYPAVVLAHGGGGCAFHEWVEFWNAKGYVAIAPDFSGQCDGDRSFDGKGAPINPQGGPQGYRPFGTTLDNYKDSWIYHSVCNAVNAHSYLRSLPQVDCSKTVMTGISWGSVITMMTSGVDDRFSCFAPVYGGGYLHKDPLFLSEDNPPADEEFWLGNFDPIAYLVRNRKPIMFTCGADDIAFAVLNNKDSWTKSAGEKYYSWRQSLPHYHRWLDEEQMINVYRFFEKFVNGKEMPFEIESENYIGGTLSVVIKGDISCVNAKVVYTESDLSFDNSKMVWKGEDVVSSGNRLVAKISDSAKLCFIQISDGTEKEFILSSKMYTL